jgi:retinol dehydrogenase-12
MLIMTDFPLRDRTCVVTGATSGIGLAAAEALARLGAKVVGVGRDPHRAEQAHERLSAAAAACAAPEPAFELADLSLMAEVRDLAARLGQKYPRIDVLANVAGYYCDKRSLSSEGLELQWAVNHLAPFLLSRELLSALRASDRPRVMLVSSESHYFGRIHWRDPSMGLLYVGILAYAQSKLANVLFVNEFARREEQRREVADRRVAKVEACAIDPGLVNTDMGGKHASFLTKLGWSLRRHSGTAPEVPAATIAFLAATDEDLGQKGRYWKDLAPKPPSPRACDEKAARRLWELSEIQVKKALGG